MNSTVTLAEVPKVGIGNLIVCPKCGASTTWLLFGDYPDTLVMQCMSAKCMGDTHLRLKVTP